VLWGAGRTQNQPTGISAKVQVGPFEKAKNSKSYKTRKP